MKKIKDYYMPYAGITLIICFAYLLMDTLLRYKKVSLRHPYYSIAVGAFLIPLIFLLIWTGINFYKKHAKKNRILKYMMFFLLMFFSTGLISASIMGLSTAREALIVVDDVSYVRNVNTMIEDDDSDIPALYFEVYNRFLYKTPYSFIDTPPVQE